MVLLGGFATAAQAQVVFSDNFEGTAAGTDELAGWASTGTLSAYSLTVAAGTGVGGSQGLTWQANFNSAFSGYMPCNLGYSGGNPSGNTSANLNDYTLSFDMAVASGVALNHLQLTLQGWEGQWFSGAGPNGGQVNIDTSAVAVGSGFQHFSLNLGTLMAGTGFDPLDQTYQFQWQMNGWELAGGGPVTGEQMTMDNVQVTMVPEPSTVALVGVGMAGLCWLRRRNA
ncbi:MAG: PEP-CTERM sorting domain-containing protein [Verrucomicrobiia bacterium]